MKAMLKSEIARAAGLSTNTLRRWMLSRQQVLRKMGVTHTQRLLPPKAVKYICHEFGINEEDL